MPAEPNTTDQAKAIELKPCPFCGPQKDEDRQPIFYEARDVRENFAHGYTIFCCVCAVEISDERQDEAIKRWNTRAVALSRASQGSRVGTEEVERLKAYLSVLETEVVDLKSLDAHAEWQRLDDVVGEQAAEIERLNAAISALSPPATPQASEDVRRDHFYSVEVFIPTDLNISEDRIRWYLDHAVRGYHRDFALDTDPIREMSRCSVFVKKLPIKSLDGGRPIATPVTVTLAQSTEIAGYLRIKHPQVSGSDVVESLRRVLGDRIQIAGEPS